MIGNILGNRYEILEKIGDGGMAFVYKAKCRILNRIVAVKVLRPEFVDDEIFISKFKNEALAAASLAHPNIVNIYDVGQDENIHYIIMEYVDGCNLKDLIKKEGSMDPYKALYITKQIAMALSQAHKKDIIHRDIKPHNILISEEGIAKVADFGIAKATTSSTITNMGSIIGSVHYFSPEQARGGYIDQRSDLYSLGIVLYEMLVGKVPFRGDTPVNIALKHISEEISFSNDMDEKIPREIRMLVYKLTQKIQGDRYSNSEELVRDIEYIENNVEPDFEEDYEYYATQKMDELNSEIKKQISNDYKEEGENINMRKKKEKKNNNKLTSVLAISLALILSLGVTVTAYFLKDLYITKEYKVPNLENLTMEDAQEKLKEAGIDIQMRKELYDSSVEKGHIITQIPQEGSIIRKGEIIRVDISKGGELVSIPNLVNEDIEEANRVLEENNLKEGVIKYEYSNLKEGSIIQQKPRAFTDVEEGTEIDLVVSKGKEVKLLEVPKLVGKTLEDARVSLVGFRIGSVNYAEDKTKEEGIILNQSVKSGQSVDEGTKIDLTVNEYKKEEKKEEITQNNQTAQKNVKKQLSITLPQDKEVVSVSVKETSKDSTVTVYNKQINIKESGSTLIIPIEGTDKKDYEIYIDDALYGRTSVNFQ